jgi:hypothetical protein
MQHAGRIGRRKGALLWTLRETNSLEEARLSVENLPFLAKSIRCGHVSFAITGNHALTVHNHALTVHSPLLWDRLLPTSPRDSKAASRLSN